MNIHRGCSEFYFSVITEPHYLILEYVMYGKLLAYLRDHRTRQYFYNFSEDSAALTSRDLTVFGYCVARGMEYLASKKVRIHTVLSRFSSYRENFIVEFYSKYSDVRQNTILDIYRISKYEQPYYFSFQI